MLLEIEHRLSFDYDAFVRESFIELRMQPKTIPHQTLLGFVIAVGPAAPVSRYRDWNDNTVHHFTITQYHTRISVVGRSRVRTHPPAPALEAVVERPAVGSLGPDLHDPKRFAGPVRTSPADNPRGRAIDYRSADLLHEERLLLPGSPGLLPQGR